MLRYLLDTNIVIYVIPRRTIRALEIFNQNAGRMAIASTTLAELMRGAEKSTNPPANLAVVEDFFSPLEVLAYWAKAVQHYGAIRSSLQAKRQTIGINELHRAAHVLSEGLTLVTNDVREFERVDASQPENWAF